MTENEIETALLGRIGANPVMGYAYAWPNQDAPGTKPYISVQIVRIVRRDPALAGGALISQGRVVATVVTALNKGTSAANAAAEAVAALFPKALKIAAGTGVITITKPADIREGFPEGGDWRTPVIVDYEAS